MEAGAGPPLSARRLSKRFGRTWALRDLDLDIAPGSVTALVGPNGAGKSTLLRSWVGFERPTSGEARVFDADPWSASGVALGHIGYVPQSSALYSDFSATDHFDLARRYRPRFDSSWALARLGHLHIAPDIAVRRLSGGQQAQIMLTLAMATRAEILLLDEPLANLDPLARRDFLYLVTDVVAQEGRTVVMSSHVIADIEQACSAVAIIDGGRIAVHGGVADVLARHRVTEGIRDGPDVVGSFREASGEWVTLVTANPGGATAGVPTATLEQLVIGYLARKDLIPEQ